MSGGKGPDPDSFSNMVQAVRAFHAKHQFRQRGGEEMIYRVALMSEELGEIAACVTKGRSLHELSEEVADLLILVMGTAIAQNFDLCRAFWDKIGKLERREGRIVNGRIRVSDFRSSDAD